MEFDMQVLSTMSSTRAYKYAKKIHEKNQIVERKIKYVYHNTFSMGLLYKV
jgi:ribosomal protein L36